MRTTVTLDDDLLQKVRDLAAREDRSFKDTLNDVVRRGLNAQEQRRARAKRYKVTSFRSAFRPGVDPMKLNQLSDQLEVEHLAARASEGESR